MKKKVQLLFLFLKKKKKIVYALNILAMFLPVNFFLLLFYIYVHNFR